MKKIWLAIILLFVLIVGYVIIQSDKTTTTLPSSFTMEVQGDFNDPLIGQNPPSSVFLISSGENELLGDAYYTSTPQGGDGYLQSCSIKNNKWLVSDTEQECSSLSRLATTRTGLIEQINTGQLKLKNDNCFEGRLCYELE
jgi:hypothetical protein